MNSLSAAGPHLPTAAAKAAGPVFDAIGPAALFDVLVLARGALPGETEPCA